MVINLEDPGVEQALRELSRETGESLTQAAGVAVRERLERLRSTRRAIVELIEEARTAPVVDSRPLKVVTDELWGDE